MGRGVPTTVAGLRWCEPGAVDGEHIGRWTDALRRAGYRPAAVLGSGMEGTVVALGDNLVAKVWHRRTEGELETLRTFYEAVADAGPAVGTPRIHRVIRLDGQVATIEALLGGRPLWTADGESPVLGDADIAAVTAVLAALVAVEPTPDMGVLPILDGEAPFDMHGTPFTRSLAQLVERRVARFRGPLTARLPDVDDIARAVVRALDDLDPPRSSLVHGDLIPANIHVDDSARPVAVLDFGFLTTIGDPAFDAAITAGIFDMYGPRAAATEAILDAAIADRFGYDVQHLAIYRAAYALATSNCFSASGSDGHFDWCVRMLQRPEILDALDR